MESRRSESGEVVWHLGQVACVGEARREGLERWAGLKFRSCALC